MDTVATPVSIAVGRGGRQSREVASGSFHASPDPTGRRHLKRVHIYRGRSPTIDHDPEERNMKSREFGSIDAIGAAIAFAAVSALLATSPVAHAQDGKTYVMK